jgi:hypothetical protein
MSDPLRPRRFVFDAAKRWMLEKAEDTLQPEGRPDDEPPRLTPKALEKTRTTMSRSRDRILGNLEDMYREAFERAKATDDSSQMAGLDFAYRREQLYFEILLDIRDALERR